MLPEKGRAYYETCPKTPALDTVGYPKLSQHGMGGSNLIRDQRNQFSLLRGLHSYLSVLVQEAWKPFHLFL